MLTNILWHFLILETFVIEILSTECKRVHTQKLHCTSDYVFIARLREKVNVTEYRISITVLYKGNKKELNIIDRSNETYHGPLFLNTDRPLIMKQGTELLIFARKENGKVFAEKCPRIMQWAFVTSLQRDGVDMFYQPGCDCIDEIGDYRITMGCEFEHSYMTKFKGKCFWARTKDYKDCKWKNYAFGRQL